MKRAPKELYECLEDVENWIKTSAIDSVYTDEETILNKIEHVLGLYKPYSEPKRFIDITGQTFNELTVLRYVGNLFFECRCSCGVIKNITGHQLRIGRTKSCGHLRNSQGGKYARKKSNNPTSEKPS